MVLHQAGVGQHTLLPVGVDIPEIVGGVCSIGFDEGRVELGFGRCPRRVGHCHVPQLHVLQPRYALGQGRGPLLRHKSVVGHLNAVATAATGFHDDDAVGRPRSVNSRRCGIFQDADALDVVGVDVVERFERVGSLRHVVDNEQGRGVGTNGPNAPDADVGSVGTRPARLLRHRNARCQALKEVRRCGNLPREQFFAADGRHRAGQVGPLLGAVAYHHDLIEVVGPSFQANVDGRAATNGLFQSGIADKAEHQRLSDVGRDRVAAGGVGDGAARGAFNGYRYARQSLIAGLVGDGARHGSLLGKCGRQAGARAKKNKYKSSFHEDIAVR